MFLKSKRWFTSFAAWLRALSTSWRSTLLTTSKDAVKLHAFVDMFVAANVTVVVWRDDGYGLIDWKQRNEFGRVVRTGRRLEVWRHNEDGSDTIVIFWSASPPPISLLIIAPGLRDPSETTPATAGGTVTTSGTGSAATSWSSGRRTRTMPCASSSSATRSTR